LQLSVTQTLDGPILETRTPRNTDIMSFVTRRALSTLIPPKVRESPFGYGRKPPVLRLIPLLTPDFQKTGRFSEGTQNTMKLLSHGASFSISTNFEGMRTFMGDRSMEGNFVMM
jgi:hypothetical protein